MILVVPGDVAHGLRAELRKAQRVETGGLLLGEHLSEGKFRVVEFTVQRKGGTRAGFVREPEEHANRLAAFFDRTGCEYARFNYLGEWHSHPSFPPTPSPSDIIEMSRLVADPRVGAEFLVLLIVRLRLFGRLTGTASLFVPDRGPTPVELVWEGLRSSHRRTTAVLVLDGRRSPAGDPRS